MHKYMINSPATRHGLFNCEEVLAAHHTELGVLGRPLHVGEGGHAQDQACHRKLIEGSHCNGSSVHFILLKHHENNTD